MKYIPRIIESKILNAAKQFPAIILTGPRQTGKSTLLKHLFPDHLYLTFDDPILQRNAKEDPGLFIDNLKPPIILDEIQYAPEILPYIKIKIDQKRDQKGQYLLTGSQAFNLMAGLTESLAGRVAVFELLPFSFEEIGLNREMSPIDLFQHLHQGFFPDPCVHDVEPQTYYSSYIQTFLQRDIRQIKSVRDLGLFQKFIELLAARAGSLLNISEVSRDCGMSHTSAQNWLSLLETSRIIYLLRPYSNNFSKRIIKSPKVYFTDTGLLSYLLKYPNGNTLQAGPMAGAIFENCLVIEFLKRKLYHTDLFELYFYRDSNKNEIDLILEGANHLELLEIKMRKNVQKRDVKTLDQLDLKDKNIRRSLVSCLEYEYAISPSTNNIPWWKVSQMPLDGM